MSSARSIATTIQRRAGDQINQRPVNPYQAQSSTVKSKTYPYQQNPNPNSQQMYVPQVKQRLTISEAIGLITIRLSKLEEHSNEGQYDNIQYDNNNNNNNNNETERIEDILARLAVLELNTNTCLKLETELRDTKDLLVKIMFKIENQYSETTTSIEKLKSQHADHLAVSQQIKDDNETNVNNITAGFEKIQERCLTRVEMLNDEFKTFVAETNTQVVKFNECVPCDEVVAMTEESNDILTHTICLEE